MPNCCERGLRGQKTQAHGVAWTSWLCAEVKEGALILWAEDAG